jgi:hypothetical protein
MATSDGYPKGPFGSTLAAHFHLKESEHVSTAWQRQQMGVYSAKAVLQGKGRDVWEMAVENIRRAAWRTATRCDGFVM